MAVFIDESGGGDAEFLLKTVDGEFIIHQADTEMEELHVKYLIEKAQPSNEKFLDPDVSIGFIRLDEATEEARPGQFLICTYKDLDDMGEKLQQKALKYFPETIDFFAEKISFLLTSGYAKVYLITDHGFEYQCPDSISALNHVSNQLGNLQEIIYASCFPFCPFSHVVITGT